MLASLNSKLYTVAALREIAARMGLAIPGKAVKAEVAALIVAGIDDVHVEALKWEAYRNQVAIAEAGGGYMNALNAAESRMRNRVQNYMESNGTDKLTKPQLRRIRKKSNRTGVNPWALSYDYSTVYSH
jgi:hypothetical protein